MSYINLYLGQLWMHKCKYSVGNLYKGLDIEIFHRKELPKSVNMQNKK